MRFAWTDVSKADCLKTNVTVTGRDVESFKNLMTPVSDRIRSNTKINYYKFNLLDIHGEANSLIGLEKNRLD